MRLKLITVRVVKELDTRFGERFTRSIEHSDGLPAFLLVEVPFMSNPGAAGILKPERLCIAGHALNIVAVALVGEMAAD